MTIVILDGNNSKEKKRHDQVSQPQVMSSLERTLQQYIKQDLSQDDGTGG